MEKIYLSPPDIGQKEEIAAINAIRSGWVAPLGPEVDAFEFEMSERVGVKHAVALSSGTAALHLALLTLNVGPGDIVITSTMTFVATANAIKYTGAEPFFVDSDLSTGNMSAELLVDAIKILRAQKKKIAAIVPVDLLGKSADYSSIIPIASEFNIPVVADAAESLGSTHNRLPVGSFGDAAVFSFNGNKIMTTSGGGMLMTDNSLIARKARFLATQAREDVTHYEHRETGYNYRLSNILAAIGRAQLSRLDQMIDRRRVNREKYRKFVANFSGVSIFGGDDSEDNCWLTAILVDSEISGWKASELSDFLGQFNIETRPL